VNTVLGNENVPDEGEIVVLPTTGSNGSGGGGSTPWVAAFGLIVAAITLLTMMLAWRQRGE
jgi:hypothetical protein